MRWQGLEIQNLRCVLRPAPRALCRGYNRPMIPDDPQHERQRLAQLYAAMSDAELLRPTLRDAATHDRASEAHHIHRRNRSQAHT